LGHGVSSGEEKQHLKSKIRAPIRVPPDSSPGGEEEQGEALRNRKLGNGDSPIPGTRRREGLFEQIFGTLEEGTRRCDNQACQGEDTTLKVDTGPEIRIRNKPKKRGKA